jgi:hypothetical protein
MELDLTLCLFADNYFVLMYAYIMMFELNCVLLNRKRVFCRMNIMGRL